MAGGTVNGRNRRDGPNQMTAMPDAEKMICPRCLSGNRVDECHEKGCPGFGGFVPSCYRRTVAQIAQDLEHYEDLILEAALYFEQRGVTDGLGERLQMESKWIQGRRKADEAAAEAGRSARAPFQNQEPTDAGGSACAAVGTN